MSRTLSFFAILAVTFLAFSGSHALGQSFTLDNDGLINISAFKLDSVGATDHDLNSTSETFGIWNAIDAGGTVPGSITIGATNSPPMARPLKQLTHLEASSSQHSTA